MEINVKNKSKYTEKRAFLKGATVIAGGGLIAKFIGALYRIPLTNLIGGYGMGLYQMVYPAYCFLLTISATGIPSSIAKMVAEERARGDSGTPVIKSALLLFSAIGLAGSLIMATFSPLLSYAQGFSELWRGYLALAPSVALVSVISVFRGWFQGKNNMFPTAISEVTEQIVKVAFGLLFAYLYRANVQKAVVYILLSVSFSELTALIFLFVRFRRDIGGLSALNEGGRVATNAILKLSIPVTLSSALLPLSALLDSVIIVRLMQKYAENAVTLYGLFSGGAVTLVNLPVSVCYGIAAAGVPALSAAFADKGNARKKMLFALFLTVAISLPCAVGLFVLAKPAVNILFRALGEEGSAVLIRLVKLLSVSAIFLSCTQTLSACLTGMGKPKYAAISMAVAVTVKTLLNVILVSDPKNSVYGAAIAADVCYFVAFFLDLLYNLYVTKTNNGGLS